MSWAYNLGMIVYYRAIKPITYNVYIKAFKRLPISAGKLLHHIISSSTSYTCFIQHTLRNICSAFPLRDICSAFTPGYLLSITTNICSAFTPDYLFSIWRGKFYFSIHGETEIQQYLCSHDHCA